METYQDLEKEAILRALDGENTEDWQVRLWDEKRELDDRILKLSEYMETDRFDDLEVSQRLYLADQHNIMIEYSSILNKRILTNPIK